MNLDPFCIYQIITAESHSYITTQRCLQDATGAQRYFLLHFSNAMLGILTAIQTVFSLLSVGSDLSDLYIYIYIFLINLFSLYLKGRETERENTERSSVYWLTPTNAHNSQEWGQGKTKSSKLQLSLLCTWYLRLPAISQHAHLQGGGSEVKEQELKEASQMAT